VSTKGDTIAGQRNMAVGMRHWNGHLLCAIDTETTGFDPELNEIVEISIIPLDATLSVHTEYKMLNMYIRPEKLSPDDARPPGLTDKKLAEYMIHGLNSFKAMEVLTEWFENLRLGSGKRVMPLGHNWPFDMNMIRSWLGPKNYDYMFHGHFRDTMALARTFADANEFHMYPTAPYSSVSLGALCKHYGIVLNNAHTSSEDALATAHLYKTMINQMRGSFG
jgi:DNA polymerase III epsilon subunit-like protein